ncbi:metallophosphoesterase [Peribacillus saganii]|uniref:Metallophosphoesterase n=2 Tax=Peribacillus saganii TaxID=2303992 RepID=A0A372LR63_9BACI|nr:metallophosphoesterase [Peribacillus saganii]
MIFYLIRRAYKNTTDIVLNRIPIENNGPVLNILQLSDLHLENISISPSELYEKLKGEPIDIIALTGDFLDRKRTLPKLAPYLKILNQLNAKHGIYAVFGNHDYVLRGENFQKLRDILEQNGCKVMQNENTTLFVEGNPVNIIGIDDFSTKRSDLKASYTGIKPGTNLVLTHDPNLVLHMKDYHFDYLLSGHFHGGQICYPKAYHLVKMGKLVRMNMIKGLHQQDGKPFYINEGLGQTGVNIRVGSRPEITLHQFSLGIAQTDSLPAI